jgi:hypothetical protein
MRTPVRVRVKKRSRKQNLRQHLFGSKVTTHMAFLATPLLIYFAYETILMKNFISFSDVKETEKLNFFLSV